MGVIPSQERRGPTPPRAGNWPTAPAEPPLLRIGSFSVVGIQAGSANFVGHWRSGLSQTWGDPVDSCTEDDANSL